MSKILIIEDEVAIADLEKDYLELSGFDVQIEYAGDKGLTRALKEDFDLIVLDLMLPGIDGFEVCRRIREEKNVPILMVSAKKDDIDKIRGLGLGADDYMTKPFSMKELMARVKANIRRRSMEYASAQASGTANTVEANGLCLNPETYQVTKNGTPVDLTQKEYDLLSYLIRERGKVFSREDLMQRVWNYDYYGDMRTVDVTVRRLREKIEDDPGKPQYILTRRGVGYYFAG